MDDKEKAKPGQKTGATKHRDRVTNAEILEIKQVVIDLIDSGDYENLSQVARYLNISPAQLHKWSDNDPEWRQQIHQAQQVVADKLEEKLDEKNHVLGYIFRLKKLRPEYRDNYKLEIATPEMTKILTELQRLGREPDLPKEVEPSTNPSVLPEEKEKPLIPLLAASQKSSSKVESSEKLEVEHTSNPTPSDGD